jgi:hypothetical protein
LRTRDRSGDITRYWAHAIVATLLVAVAPPGLVMWLEAAGYITSSIVAIAAGIFGSMAAAAAGTALWMRHSGSGDLVFGDLMLWGYLRRLVMEKRIMNSAKLMAGIRQSSSSRSRAEQIQTLQKLAATLEARDPYTHGHSRRVARLSAAIAKELGLKKAMIKQIRTAAALHDVGKLGVPLEVINKPGKLTAEEFEIVKGHAARGAKLVATTGDRELTAIVRHHHERMDGGGYPDRLAGLNIPLGARIVAVADTFDAITSSRSYRSAAKHKSAMTTLKACAGTQLDLNAVNAFSFHYSGRKSLLRWAAMLSAPHRLIGQVVGWFQGAAASGLGTTAGAAGTAALLSGSLIGGAVVAPAVAKTPTAHAVFAAFAGHEETSLGRQAGLPPGIAKREALPRGLAKTDRLPRDKKGKQAKAVPHEYDREKDHAPRGLTEEPKTSSSASSSSSGNGPPDSPGKS